MWKGIGIITQTNEHISKAISYNMRNNMYKYQQEVISNDSMKLSYKLNTIAQTCAFNNIWADESKDEQVEISQEFCDNN